MSVFVSHSSRDADAVQALVTYLEGAGEDVWLDMDLRGGQDWWSTILEQIRNCTVFVVAVSANTLRSKPCGAEIGYAFALRLPILPVQVGNIGKHRGGPLFDLEWVDYRHPDANTRMTLLAALTRRAAERTELPEPLPAPPPLPYEYLQRLGSAIGDPRPLTPAEQASIVLELRTMLDDENDAGVRGDIVALLAGLSRRTDTTHAVGAEIDELLGADGAGAKAGRRPRQPKRLLLTLAAFVLVAVGIAAAAIFLVASPSVPAAQRAAPSASARPRPAVSIDALDGLLLSPAEIDRFVAATGLAVAQRYNDMGDNSAAMVERDCLIVFTTDAAVYAGSDWSAVRGQILKEPGETMSHFVQQAVVAFPTAGDATAFFTTSAQRWSACSDHRFTYTKAGQPAVVWTVGSIKNSDGVLTVLRTEEGADGWACQRALSVRNNVAIDVMACSTKPGNAAADIGNRIASKIPG